MVPGVEAEIEVILEGVSHDVLGCAVASVELRGAQLCEGLSEGHPVLLDQHSERPEPPCQQEGRGDDESGDPNRCDTFSAAAL